jgi:two-component system CheB/CheR fusion protein
MHNSFYVVGLGASGYGISALLEFFRSIPAHTGAAYIAVTHQKRDRESRFHSLIEKSTAMPVVRVTHNTQLLPDHVYVIVENTYITVSHGNLYVKKRPDENLNEAIDVLFCSLADDCKSKAVGIIFWGLGTDGVAGITAIEREGGFVIVQQPDDSRNSEMAQRAIDEDHPNVVTKVAEIGDHLLMHMNIKEPRY